MAAAASVAVVKDGNNVSVGGGVRTIDESGVGTGPFDGVAVLYHGQDVPYAAGVLAADETIASTKYGLLTRVVGLLQALGALAESAPASDTASSGINGRLQRVAQNLTSGLTLAGAVGETAPASDTASSGLNGRLQRIAQRLTSLLPSAAHDAAVAGNPNRIAARAATSNYTAVADGDTADLLATLVGALVNKPYSIPEADWQYAAAASGILNTTTAVTIKAAGAAGLRNYITGIDIMAEALGTASEVAIRDGASGTVLWRTKIGTGGLVAGRSIRFATPLRGTAATLLEVVTLTASGTGAVYFNAQGYTAP